MLITKMVPFSDKMHRKQLILKMVNFYFCDLRCTVALSKVILHL